MKTEINAQELSEIVLQMSLALGYSLAKHSEFPSRATYLRGEELDIRLNEERKFNDGGNESMLSVLKEESLEFASEYSKGNYEEAEKEGYHVMAVAARMVLAARNMKKGKK